MIMNNILDKINASSEIAISFHLSPDGDSVGSALALQEGLKKLGKSVYIMSKEQVPYDLAFLLGSETIDGNTFKVLPSTDMVIILDCGDVKRINADIDMVSRKYVLVNLDHHLSNDMYGDLNYVDTNSSAMAEIVYQMLNILGVSMSKSIAACLYTSIITDTGSFRYSSTTSVTHAIAGHLINTGINFSEIHRKAFDDKPFNRVKFIGKAIDNMELVSEKICVFKLTEDNFSELGIEPSVNTSDIISIGLEINSVEVSVLLKESADHIKVSLRSKADVDVRKIAEKFGGGGHAKASGLAINNVSLEEAKKLVIKEIEKELI
jgi:phosphoesterase RecJ-like protein